MASFAYHLGISGAAAAGAGFAAYNSVHATMEESVCLGVLVLGSGFIADLDSADSHHTHHALNIASSVAPALVLTACHGLLLTPTITFLLSSLSFLSIRVLLREIVRHLSSPRGMFHSIPAVLIWGAMVFLAFRSIPESIRLLFAAGAGGGYLLHLLLDVMMSGVSMSGQNFDPKQHSGFALKAISPSIFANVVAYGLLLSLSLVVLHEVGVLVY